mgnify:CR=1 FL=1
MANIRSFNEQTSVITTARSLEGIRHSMSYFLNAHGIEVPKTFVTPPTTDIEAYRKMALEWLDANNDKPTARKAAAHVQSLEQRIKELEAKLAKAGK